jgi:phosphoribosyl isomerase A
MQLIPVLDIKEGQVVRAQRGDRQRYRPIVSQLCDGSDPVQLAQALCEHCASPQLYVADLDALMGGATQTAVLQAILHAQPALELWLDAGLADAAAAQRLLAALGATAAQVRLVFGSESIASADALATCFDDGRAILSLDRRDGQRLDQAGCWDRPAQWPKQVIVMTLERVGADAGPDLHTLQEVQQRSPHTHLIGAGGIRHANDLARAQAAGARAWLVASALHDGRLPRASR